MTSTWLWPDTTKMQLRKNWKFFLACCWCWRLCLDATQKELKVLTYKWAKLPYKHGAEMQLRKNWKESQTVWCNINIRWDATQKELKARLQHAVCTRRLVDQMQLRKNWKSEYLPLKCNKRDPDATQKELKGRPLSHRVSARVTERFSWVRLGCLSIGFCD